MALKKPKNKAIEAKDLYNKAKAKIKKDVKGNSTQVPKQ